MGKKLVIKGADFSENGFVYEIVKKEITDLYDWDGNLVGEGETTSSEKSLYFYEHATSGALTAGKALASYMSTRNRTTGVDIDVEDYTDATVETRVNQGSAGIVAGVAVLFFLDANKNIIGGFSSGDSQRGCVNVGASVEQRTFSMKIPNGAKYAICTAFGRVGTTLNFKLTLSKKVIG